MKLKLPLLFGISWMLAVTAMAQEAEAPQDALGEIRQRETLTDEDRNAIRTFVEQRVRDIASGEAIVARPAVAALRAAYVGTDAFKSAYADIATGAVRTAVRRADLVPATQLVAILGSFRNMEARPLFIELLEDERVGVRAAAALGLRTLRPQIAQAGGDVYTGTLQALRAAGEQERSRDTLRGIYSAMDYAGLEQSPPLRPLADQLLPLLETRAAAYRAGGDVPAVGADDAGLLLARQMLETFNPAEQNRVASAAARMTKFAIEQYRSPKKELTELRDKTASQQLLAFRNAMERLVLAGERVLAAVLNPEVVPNVMEGMGSLDTTRMKLEWQQWNTLLKQRLNTDFALEEENGEAAGNEP